MILLDLCVGTLKDAIVQQRCPHCTLKALLESLYTVRKFHIAQHIILTVSYLRTSTKLSFQINCN